MTIDQAHETTPTVPTLQVAPNTLYAERWADNPRRRTLRPPSNTDAIIAAARMEAMLYGDAVLYVVTWPVWEDKPKKKPEKKTKRKKPEKPEEPKLLANTIVIADADGHALVWESSVVKDIMCLTDLVAVVGARVKPLFDKRMKDSSRFVFLAKQEVRRRLQEAFAEVFSQGIYPPESVLKPRRSLWPRPEPRLPGVRARRIRSGRAEKGMQVWFAAV